MRLTPYERMKFPGTNQHLVLINMIRKHSLRRGAEIGVLKGKTISNILGACPDVFMYGVDQWQERPYSEEPGAETYVKLNLPACKTLALQRLSPYQGRFAILEGDSARMAESIEDGSLDFVFIDGDHTYVGVRRDIMAWVPKVHEAGWIFGHDWNWPPVREALCELVPGYAELEHFVWAIPRRDVEVVRPG